jgi:hypothetical protein
MKEPGRLGIATRAGRMMGEIKNVDAVPVQPNMREILVNVEKTTNKQWPQTMSQICEQQSPAFCSLFKLL